MIPEIAEFVRRESWGESFPLDVEDFLRHADKIYVSLEGDRNKSRIAGCICVTRYRGCPDDYTNTNPFICCWAVLGELRGRGIGKELFNTLFEFILANRTKYAPVIFATADNADAAKALTHRELEVGSQRRVWHFVRRGQNEDGGSTSLFALAL
jgi:ribosomal protein S18 acetylase RimI-like enzyme